MLSETSQHLDVPGRDGFRALMTQWPTGVTVVSTLEDGLPVGCTVSAMMSLSDAPPLVVVSLLTRSHTLRAIRREGRFAITVLSAGQGDLCTDFAVLPGPQRFSSTTVRRVGALPLPDGGVAAMTCDVADVLPYADHAMVIGAPRWSEVNPELSPLVMHRREFRTMR
jgi:flavin reductase (DIM6/NTAB) family NADH-FMN oxidoreductase RutF